MTSHERLYSAFEDEYAAICPDSIYSFFRRWLTRPEVLGSDCSLRVNILNELTWCLGEMKTANAAWMLIVELVRDWSQQKDLRKSIVISTFELFSEPPEVPETLELLFSLAGDPETRWAVFDSYENYPWRLRSHAEKYSGGLISSSDCDEWLASQGHGDDEVLIPKISS